MRIAQMSGHEGQGVPQICAFIKAHNIDVAGLTEMDLGSFDRVAEIRKGMGSKYSTYALNKGKHSSEIVLVVRKRVMWRTTDVNLTALSDDIPGRGTGNDRWLLEVVRKRRIGSRTHVHLLTHLNAGIQNPDTGVIHHNDPKTLANLKSMTIIRNRVVTRNMQGHGVTLQGDFNVKRMPNVATFEDWKYLPDNFLSKQLKGISNRLDWILFNNKFKIDTKPTSTFIVPANSPTNPSDHDIIVTTLVRKTFK
jgi:hypothetical protein